MEAVLREAGREWGTTVVFSTHNFSQASRLADDILYLSEGRRVEFSHENCFSGTAATDGRTSWIEPKPGVRIVFPGAAAGHVTCVIDPAAIRLFAAGGGAAPPAGPERLPRPGDPDGDDGRRRRPSSGSAATSSSGPPSPSRELEAGGISLSREVLLRFEPESVRIVGERPADAGRPS